METSSLRKKMGFFFHFRLPIPRENSISLYSFHEVELKTLDIVYKSNMRRF
jgi:hypothetical protein